MDKPSAETAVLIMKRRKPMYFVGIDISKFKHDCAVLDEIGDLITTSWSFSNDREGFSTLKDFLDSLESEKRIGFESTGHCGQNLKLFLESNGFIFTILT